MQFFLLFLQVRYIHKKYSDLEEAAIITLFTSSLLFLLLVFVLGYRWCIKRKYAAFSSLNV